MFKEQVTHDQRRNDPDPELGRFMLQIIQRFPELRINAEPSIDLLQGREDLRSEAVFLSPGSKPSQLVANSFRVGELVWNQAVEWLTHTG